uniref:Uncharacterized protein n=1 Tax=Arundo donax TaxID=35708 RepID=A0A0A8ZC76_ARUDO
MSKNIELIPPCSMRQN